MEETRKNEPGGQPGKEKKPKRELSPKEVQQRKKMIVFPLMFFAFAGCMYLIFAPSGKDKTDVESVGGFNAYLPLPAEDGIIADKQTAYEQAVVSRKRQDRIQSCGRTESSPCKTSALRLTVKRKDGKETQNRCRKMIRSPQGAAVLDRLPEHQPPAEHVL